MTEFEDPAEDITAAMAAMVDGELAPPAVRRAVTTAITTPTVGGRRRRPAYWLLGSVAAISLVVIGFLTLNGNDDAAVDVATAPGTSAANDGSPSTTRPRSTTTGAVPSTVVGTTTPVTTPSTIAPLPGLPVTTVPAPTPTTARPSAPGPTPTVVAPPTTACRNSTNPACGAFRWDPRPSNQPGVARITLPSGPIVAGVVYEATFTLSDPDGPVGFDCYDFNGPSENGTYIGGACTTERTVCPDRYGPWTPPAGAAGSASITYRVRFDNPGPVRLTLKAAIPTGDPQFCANVSPYLSEAAGSLVVNVVAPTP